MALIDKISKAGGIAQGIPEVPKVRPMEEIGVSGLLRTKGVGFVYEEWLSELGPHRQKLVYREMRDNDAVIGSMFFALEMILRRSEWRVEPAKGAKGDEYAEFIQSCMKDMCYDDQTEVLTKRGWVLFKNLDEKDLVAQRSPKGFLEYVKPQAIHVHDFDGELLGSSGDSVDFLVTPTHRMLFAPRTGRKHDSSQKENLGIHKCEDIYGKSGWLSKKAEWRGKSSGNNSDWLEFLGFFLADGCANPRQVVLIQKETRYVESLLDRVGLSQRFHRRSVNGSTQWCLSDVKLATQLREDFGVGSRQKSLPQWLKDSPPDEIRSFLRGFVEGDGSELKSGLIAMYTSSRKLADDLQELAIKAGRATTLLTRVQSPSSFNPGAACYRVAMWAKEEALRPYLKSGRSWYKQQYTGKVYCVSVPSGVIMVRRNGKPMWCGNSHTWEDFIAECVSQFAFGFSLFETVYKRRNGPKGKKGSRFSDGKIGWRKLAPRAQESILYWVWDDEGGLQGAVQLAAPDYQTVVLPIEKLLLFRTTSQKNNPEGRSMLRNCYRSWFFKRRIEEVEGIGIERDICGLPVLYADGEALEQMGGMAAAKKLVTNIRMDDQAGVVLPLLYDDNGNQLVKFELMRSGGTKVADVNGAINRYNQDMLNTILSGFIQFGQTPTGSRALHMSATQIFSLAITAFMDSISAVMNRVAIPRLLALNQMDVEFAPEILPGEIGVRDLQELSDYISKLATSGLTFFDKKTADYLRKVARLPEAPEVEEAPPLGSSATVPPPPQFPGNPEQSGKPEQPVLEEGGSVEEADEEVEAPPAPTRKRR